MDLVSQWQFLVDISTKFEAQRPWPLKSIIRDGERVIGIPHGAHHRCWALFSSRTCLRPSVLSTGAYVYVEERTRRRANVFSIKTKYIEGRKGRKEGTWAFWPKLANIRQLRVCPFCKVEVPIVSSPGKFAPMKVRQQKVFQIQRLVLQSICCAWNGTANLRGRC